MLSTISLKCRPRWAEIRTVTVQPLDSVEKVPGLPKLPFVNVAEVLLSLAQDPSRAGQRLLISI